MLIDWISNSRRAHQRLGFLKVALDGLAGPQTSTEVAERVRPLVTHPVPIGMDSPIASWCKDSRNGLLITEGAETYVQAQGYYLFHLYSRTGWLSPKGINEYVEVMPRRLGLADSLFRLTETGHAYRLLVPTNQPAAWTDASSENDPLSISRDEKYFLAHQVLQADGDFLIPWLAAIARSVRTHRFTYLDAGACIPDVLAEMIAAFSGSAYLDVDRQQLKALESAEARVRAEIAVEKHKEGSGARRDQLTVPRLEWLVDLGLLSKLDRDDSTYEFTDVGVLAVDRLVAAYEKAAQSGYPEKALDTVLESHFVDAMAPILGINEPKPATDVVSFLKPAFDLMNSITGYCLLKPLNLLAATEVARSRGQCLLEYSDTVRLVEEASKADPERIHYTVDRLTTDYQVKLFSA